MCTLSQHRARLPRFAHVAVLLTWCIVPTAMAQTPAVESLTAGSAVVWSERVPAGELHGAVVDAATGLPLDSIWVAIDGTNTLALTNPAGQFVLRGIGKGGERYLVRAYAPGFRIEELVVTTRGVLDGWAARFSMRRPPEQCESTTFVVRADAGDGWIPGYMVQLQLDSVPSPDTVASYDMAISRPRGEPNDPFGAVGYLTATPDGFIHGRTDRAEFRWRGPSGRVRQILRWVPQQTYPTQEDLDAYIEQYRSMLTRFNPGMPADRVQEILDEFEVSFDNPLPLFQSLRGQSDGSLWLADYDVRNMMGSEPREYLALSPDGEELRKFVFPESVQILDVSDARALGVVSSDMDVQHVVVYELEP